MAASAFENVCDTGEARGQANSLVQVLQVKGA